MSDDTTESAESGRRNPVLDNKRIRYPRAEAGLEFARIANFTDAVYAIALTLIAVELKPPILSAHAVDEPAHEGAEQLWEMLLEMRGEILIFFIAFAVMGAYWFQNHRFIAGLRRVDNAFIMTLLPYLAFIAFLPFPAATMGRYDGNPTAVAMFAVVMAAVSFIECLLLRQAHRADLFIVPLTDEQYKWAFLGSLGPVAIFLLSVPVMVVAHSTLAGFAIWTLNVPVGYLLNARSPGPDAPDVETAVPD